MRRRSEIAALHACDQLLPRRTHSNGASGDKHLPETMGAGAGWIDFDGDGRLDLYLVDSGRLPATGSADSEGAAQAALRSARDADHREAGDDGRNLLYRGVGEGVFTSSARASPEEHSRLGISWPLRWLERLFDLARGDLHDVRSTGPRPCWPPLPLRSFRHGSLSLGGVNVCSVYITRRTSTERGSVNLKLN